MLCAFFYFQILQANKRGLMQLRVRVSASIRVEKISNIPSSFRHMICVDSFCITFIIPLCARSQKKMPQWKSRQIKLRGR